METMYYIGLDVHKRTISYCVKDSSRKVHSQGQILATRYDLDRWMKTLPQPWSAAMEATMFSCDTPIALLKVDSKRQIRHPEDFQATCPSCGFQFAYDSSELQIRKVEGIHAFKAADGFLNVTVE